MSNTNDIAVRIAEIEITVEVAGAPRPQIILAEPYQPSNVSSTNCPFFINEIHGSSSDIPISSGQQYLSTDFHLVLCVKRKEAGTDLKLSLQETLLWRDAVYATFANRVKLSDPANDNVPGQAHAGLPYVLDAHITSWEAISYQYGDMEFLALKFILNVNEMFVTTINA